MMQIFGCVIDMALVESIMSLGVIACVAAFVVWTREQPFSVSFELNDVYHVPLDDVETLIKPYEELELSAPAIRNVMQLATIYARPDYVLARNYSRYKSIVKIGEEAE